MLNPEILKLIWDILNGIEEPEFDTGPFTITDYAAAQADELKRLIDRRRPR